MLATSGEGAPVFEFFPDPNMITATNSTDFNIIEQAVSEFDIQAGIHGRMSVPEDHQSFFIGQYDPEHPFVVLEISQSVISENPFKFRNAFKRIDHIHFIYETYLPVTTMVRPIVLIEGIVGAVYGIRVVVKINVQANTPLSFRFIKWVNDYENQNEEEEIGWPTQGEKTNP